MPRPLNCLFPRHRNGDVYWHYLIGFTDGRIKIGMTGNPRLRLTSHKTAHGNSIAWVHLFGARAIKRYMARRGEEWALDAFVAAGAARIGRTEVVTGISKDDAIKAARRAFSDQAEDHERFERQCAANGAAYRAQQAAWAAFKAQYVYAEA